jgi:hypothetical protein
MTVPGRGSVTIETTVAATGSNTGIVPGEVIDQLAAGMRPPVAVSVNGYDHRSTSPFSRPRWPSSPAW